MRLSVRYKPVLLTVVMAIMILLTIGPSTVKADEDEANAEAKRLEALDAGVDTIDVSKYPKEMQEKYEVVKAKCTTCHALARIINSEMALSDEWKRYIKRMRRKPQSGIKKKDAKMIWEFLTYDSQQRKAELIKKKEVAAAAEEKDGK